MLHGIKDKHAIRDVIILVCCEPVRENRIWGPIVLPRELLDSYSRVFKFGLETIELLLSLVEGGDGQSSIK
jgi:hypothetical protein